MEDVTKTYFLPYQARLIADPARYILYEKSARIGITHAVACKVVKACIDGKWHKTWWYQANDDGTAKEFIQDVGEWAKIFNFAYGFIGEEVIDEKEGIKGYTVKFADGHRIIALSSNPKALYGKGGNVILDEFAVHEAAHELYIAAQRSIMWGGCFLIFSQHYHENTEFNQLCKTAHAIVQGKLRPGKDAYPWSLHRTTIVDAVQEGFFEKLKSKGATEAESREEFIELIRSGCKTQQDFDRIYMCIPATEADAYISMELIQACQDNQVEVNPGWARAMIEKAEQQYIRYKSLQEDPDPQHMELREILSHAAHEFAGEIYGGRDIGRNRDFTLDWILRRAERGLKTVALIELDKKPFWVQAKILFALLKLPTVRRWCIDCTGLGMETAERATALFGESRVEGINFSLETKEAMAGLVLRHHQDRSISTPAIGYIADSLHSVKRYSTSTGHFRFDAERTEATGHADHFWALGLALSAAEQPGCSVPDVQSAGRRAYASAEVF
jgi:phage FluMu gp28-like protein